MGSRRALALLVTVGVLGVLALLAVAFVTMAQLERRASQQRLHATKALLLARSGLEAALARLSSGQDPSLPSARYGGEDWADDGSDAYDQAQEAYQAGRLNREDCPLRHALRPSFFAADGTGKPLRIRVGEWERGYSGRLTDEHGTQGNTYALKIEDESAKINLNGGFLDARDRDKDGVPDFQDPDVRANPGDPKDTGMGWNFQLARILNVLGSQPEVLGPAFGTLGTLAIQSRPLGGYASVAQFQTLAGIPLDLSPWLTVSSWSDAKVVHPNGYAGESFPKNSQNDAYSEMKKLRLALRLEEGGRPPVNLNTAPRPVLVSLLQDLQGSSVYRIAANRTPIKPFALGPAEPIADAICAFRSGIAPFPGWSDDPNRPLPGPFDSWETFAAFCDGLVPTLIDSPASTIFRDGGGLSIASLLKANFDPNTHLNKQLPDELMHYWVDKSDLNRWSTEGSLHATGIFRITCVGRLMGSDGRLLAERSLAETSDVFTLTRQTTQEDFVGGRTRFEEYLSRSSDPFAWQTLGASSPSWKTWPTSEGLAVMTYPSAPAALPGSAADFDGAIGLATVEIPQQGHLLFLHHFDDGWDGDAGTKPRQPGPGSPPSDQYLQTDVTRSVWPDPTLPAPQNEPNTLYPDGAHIQKWRGPAYSTANFPPPSLTAGTGAATNHGTIGYWLKPTIPPNAMTYYHLSSVRFSATETQAMAMGQYAGTVQQANWIGIMVETREGGDGLPPAPVFERVEVQQLAGGYHWMPALRWKFVTGVFNTAADPPEDATCDVQAVDGLPPDTAPMTPISYRGTVLDHTQSSDLFENTPAFVVGYQRNAQQGVETSCLSNEILDELAICDFANATDAKGWATSRYRDGRYYKGDDGTYLSPVLEAGRTGAARLLWARWTQYLPRENRQETLLHQEASDAILQYVPRKTDPILAKARLELTLLKDTGALTGPGLQPLLQGEPIRFSLPRFRYRVSFRTASSDPNDPVLETPWLDDVTFAWEPPGGPRILAWE